MFAVVGLAIRGDDLVGIVMSVLITAYLVYALIRPEAI